MRRAGLIPAALLLALMPAACAELGVEAPKMPDSTPAPEASAEATVASGTESVPEDATAATAESDAAQAVADTPHFYMALQPDPAGPTSVILAIDESRDNTPSDDPAIRLTPANGKCNPQQLRWYKFPPERAQRPVYGPVEVARGVTARDLPEFMAMAVTSQMMADGLIDEPDQSRPQNVCTRKLLQRLIIDRSTAGQPQTPPA